MRRLLPIIALMMLALTGWSAMAHVAEETGGKIAGVEIVTHAPGDGDEVPADSDNGLPHHHISCHGHDVGAPLFPATALVHGFEPAHPSGFDARALLAADENVALRPPQA
ncbi:hypothetical protein PMI04_020445 [Sphingobium sp. AP49]|uniref:hypothetical protein n=1 Tax=Sphingobium sp. AP49 TaxID=1144307 RepID=UPI00026EDACC|nr:hypothetical protein [Sphingobium sp. AP49]WHO38875.1 hypothetical protein PMI04_020445 [Sphingobium sp. AP49]